MNKRQTFYLGCFFNRIAARYGCNPLTINPLTVLQDFFAFAEPAIQLKTFEDFCLAALSDHYQWENGSPGNGLHYGEQLELLVEATYLIYKKPIEYASNKPQNIIPEALPLLLNRAEHADPRIFLKTFFATISLPGWKKQLAIFTSAAISRSSVTDELAGTDIYKFITGMPKLVYAAYRFL